MRRRKCPRCTRPRALSQFDENESYCRKCRGEIARIAEIAYQEERRKSMSLVK